LRKCSNGSVDFPLPDLIFAISQAHVISFIGESAARCGWNWALVEQLSAEEMIIMQRALREQG
jgi:hypothetical protein